MDLYYLADMQQAPYTLTELIQNDDFIEWVLRPNETNEARWQSYLDTFPEKRSVVEDAKGYVILLAVDTGRHQPSPEQSDRMWQVVQGKMNDAGAMAEKTTKIRPIWKTWQIAASVALMVGIGTAGYWYYGQGNSPFREAGSFTSASQDSDAATRKVNNTDKPMTVLLEDGSSVVLSPGSALKVASFAESRYRKVTLTGRAFFEIVKNPSSPFYVFTDGLTTKVLGTSFLIDAREGIEEIQVEVKTGRVSVFPVNKKKVLTANEDPIEEPGEEGIILIQDQKIAISRLSGKTIKPIQTGTSMEVSDDITGLSFTFDETPVSRVFEIMESAYHVSITYDKSLMGDCPLNAELNGQPFHKKLSVICSALGAEFEIHENEVTITGSGCR